MHWKFDHNNLLHVCTLCGEYCNCDIVHSAYCNCGRILVRCTIILPLKKSHTARVKPKPGLCTERLVSGQCIEKCRNDLSSQIQLYSDTANLRVLYTSLKEALRPKQRKTAPFLVPLLLDQGVTPTMHEIYLTRKQLRCNKLTGDDMTHAAMLSC